jgi:DNA-binding MarR family transcriptional regulator
MIDKYMNDPWTPHTVANELLDVLPAFARIMFSHANTLGEEKTTLMQVRVLSFLMENRLTVSDLAKKRRVSLQSASTLVQGLVERGWVTRVPDPDDRRRSLLEVTPEGLTRAALARERLLRYLTTFLDSLEPDEIAAGQVFLPALRRILHKHMLDAESDPSE